MYSQHYIYEIHPLMLWHISNLSNILSPFFLMKVTFLVNIWNCLEGPNFLILKHHSTQLTFSKLTYWTISNVTFLKWCCFWHKHMFSYPGQDFTFNTGSRHGGRGRATRPGHDVYLKMTFFWTWKINSNLQNESGWRAPLMKLAKRSSPFSTHIPLELH